MDWSNVYLGALKDHGIRVDPMKLRTVLGAGRRLMRVHYFSATDENNPGQARFEAMLQRHGFIVHTQPLEERVRKVQCPDCGAKFDPVCPTCGRAVELPPHKSKMTDIDLATRLLILADDYDEAVLVSGDKDFIPVIDWLRTVRNKRVVVFAWKKAFSGMLVGKVDEVHRLDDHVSEIRE
ncbi:MAG: hypothetical protein A3K65_01755 [Euryarchaeota archaeon RBG_16_68_12]|nr:MAG: hypothetical protein A3K65_01755 [Euryarchaeota archaeon RBG_16_68_12]